MQRLKGRNIVFGALAVLACSGDPTGNESTPTAIQSNPDVVFVTQGDSEPVVVTVLDEDGNVLQADVTASDIGSGITVRLDPTYQEVTTGNPIQRGSRFFVKGVDLAQTSFKVTALGLTKTIEVTSVPGELDAEITDSQPELGETVTITAPTGTFFTDSSVVTFNGAEAVITAKDETTISFIPMANVFGPALVSNVGVASNSALSFDLTTPFNVQTDSIIDLGTAVTPLAPALGAPITVTLPAGLKVIPESLFASGIGADTVPRGLLMAGSTLQPLNITVSADSTQITFIPPPNVDSTAIIPGIIPAALAACCAGAASYPLTLATTAKVTTPAVTELAATVSPTATPAANVVVTITSTNPQFTLDQAAGVTVNGHEAVITQRTGNSVSFVPTPADTGAPLVSGVNVVGFPLDLPIADSIRIAAIVPAAGSDDPGSAPPLPMPGAVGETSAFWDTPNFDTLTVNGTPDHFYGFNVPANGSYRVTIDWDVGDDLDGILCTDATCASFVPGVQETASIPPEFIMATGDHPEIGVFPLTPAPHVLLVEDFGCIDELPASQGGGPDLSTLCAIGAKVLITITRTQ